MEPKLSMEGTCLTVLLPGELDHPASERIRKETERVMEKAYVHTLVFDFSDTGFMDSSGVGLIMGRYRALGMRRGCVRAVQVSDYIDKLLRLSGIHRYIEIQKRAEIIGE